MFYTFYTCMNTCIKKACIKMYKNACIKMYKNTCIKTCIKIYVGFDSYVFLIKLYANEINQICLLLNRQKVDV